MNIYVEQHQSLQRQPGSISNKDGPEVSEVQKDN